MDISLMKAAIFKKYGAPDVLEVALLPKPVPGENDILVRNYASSVNSGDWKLRQPDPAVARLIMGLFAPRKSKRILGTVYAGVVERVGSKVTTFTPGDHVLGMSGFSLGAHANYLCVKEHSAIALLASDISFTNAAAIPFGATTALHFLRKAQIQAGQDIMVYGASGAVGTAAIQLAKHFGARVTAVCSRHNEQLVRNSGADFHIDYTDPHFEKHHWQYDIVFETVGKLSLEKLLSLTRPGGTIILGSAGFRDLLFAKGRARRQNKTLITGIAMEKKEQMEYISALLSRNILQPVIENIYSLEQIAVAHRHAQSGRKKGNVVLSIDDGQRHKA